MSKSNMWVIAFTAAGDFLGYVRQAMGYSGTIDNDISKGRCHHTSLRFPSTNVRFNLFPCYRLVEKFESDRHYIRLFPVAESSEEIGEYSGGGMWVTPVNLKIIGDDSAGDQEKYMRLIRRVKEWCVP